jgi:hypothetical protein
MEAAEEECHDHYVGGNEEDVDDNMVDSLFELSAYVSYDGNNNDNDNDDEEIDDDENNVNPAQLLTGGGGMMVVQVAQGWTYHTGDVVVAPDVTISIDGVDQRLRARAREEVPAVLDKIKRKLFGKRKRDMSKVLPGNFLTTFMDPLLLGTTSQGGGFYTDSSFCTLSVLICNILLQIVILFMFRYVFHSNSSIFCVNVMFS